MGGTLYTDELQIEKESADRGIERYYAQARDAVDRGNGAGLKPAERLIVYWMDGLVPWCESVIKSCQAGEADAGRVYYGYVLASMDAKRVAYSAMYHCMSALMAEPSGIAFTRLAGRIGRAIFAEWCIDRMKEIDRETKKSGARKHAWEAVEYQCKRRWKRPTPERTIAFYRLATSSDVEEMKCTATLGATMLSMIQGACVLPKDDGSFFPAVTFQNRKAGKYRKKFAVLDTLAQKIIEEGHSQRCVIRPRYSFMVIPPMPWVQDGEIPGGYIRNRTPLVSMPSRRHKQLIANKDMTPVFEKLQSLQEQGWQLNKRVCRVVSQMWRDGDIVEGIPNPNDEPIPQRAPEGSDDATISAAKKKRADAYSENVARRSARTQFITMLDEARRFVDRESVYMPHQLDFRGRCYPLPAALNHHGGDMYRGMLMFNEAGEPSEEADRWLLIHAANCYGVDKLPYDGRVEWAKDNIKSMAKVAEDPIACPDWRKAEKPFQYLAACLALFDPEIGAKLPYQADGTCNGLQQYAALGRDAEAAPLVNLVDTQVPGDVYTAVLEKVIPVVRADSQRTDGKRLADRPDGKQGPLVRNIAARLLPRLKRSTVKQPVMTVVYGVTDYGATDQIYAQLEGDSEDANDESKYLVKIVMDSIGDVLKSASTIMAWLSGLARATAEAGHHVEWETPIGFPCIQDYSNYGSHIVNTVCGRLRVASSDLGPKIGKQTSAFPPNYIHGVDAAHMLMTAHECRLIGIPFAGVHDSFWTNAAGASRLHAVLRGTFAHLHSRPLLNELVEQMRVKFTNVQYPDPPDVGSYDPNDSVCATYMFN